MKIEHIFNTTQNCTQIDLKACVPVNLNMSKVTTGPFIIMAVKEFWLEYLPFELYKWLSDGFVKTSIFDSKTVFHSSYTGDELEHWEELVCCARCVLAWYAYAKMIEILGVSVSDGGITQRENQDAARPDKWMYDNSYWGAFNNAQGEMERLIYDCLCPKGAIYEKYGFKPKKWCCRYIIPTPKIFSNHQTLGARGRFYTWIKLLPHLSKAERLFVKPLLCNLYTELKECKEYDDEIWEELQQIVRDYLADVTLKLAKPFLNIQPTGDGFKVLSGNSSTRKIERAKYEEIRHADYTIESISPKNYKALIQHLQANEDTFPDWNNSTCNPDYEEEDLNPCNCGKCNQCQEKGTGFLAINKFGDSNTIAL